MGRLLRYLVWLFHQDFWGEVRIPFKGRGTLGQITVTQGYLEATIPEPDPRGTAALEAELRRLVQSSETKGRVHGS